MFKDLANAVRFLSISQVCAAKSGHLGMPLGAADCLTVLFKDHLKFCPSSPLWPNRDRFILSGGHGSSLLYSLLYLTGYSDITIEQLKSFRKFSSLTQGHPEYNPQCGIECTTGLLGQGIASAVGVAIGERILSARYGKHCIDHYTYVCAGDGDLMEGVAHEASSIAGHLSLGKLIVLFDDNNITIDGTTDVSTSEDVLKRYESYGWQVLSVDGHEEEEISNAIKAAKVDPRPSIISCRTIIGYGSPRKGLPKAHSGFLSEEELQITKKTLNWQYQPFEIPDYLLKTWRIIGKKHDETCKKWYDSQSERYGSDGFEFTDDLRKALRGLKKKYFVSRPFAATRTSSSEVIDNMVDVSNLIVSGSCDLGGSTGCLTKKMKPITKNDFSGNYIHYGVREHAMGAIINGINLHKKIRCFGSTFLVFSDYMRPAIRMSALMNIPSIFVFSHDSIGVGEDGATHQPIEHIPSLRAIPNLNVFRPSDAMETLECWEAALKSRGPSVLVLSRQDLLSTRFCGRANLCEHGGYLLYDDTSAAKEKVTIISTGSEMSIALEVKTMLNDIGISVNVVSMPCWKLFDEQSAAYKNEVLGQGLRVAIEASNGFGWEKYLGENGLFFGTGNRFGNSCASQCLYDFFGLTAANIFDHIKKRLAI